MNTQKLQNALFLISISKQNAQPMFITEWSECPYEEWEDGLDFIACKEGEKIQMCEVEEIIEKNVKGIVDFIACKEGEKIQMCEVDEITEKNVKGIVDLINEDLETIFGISIAETRIKTATPNFEFKKDFSTEEIDFNLFGGRRKKEISLLVIEMARLKLLYLRDFLGKECTLENAHKKISKEKLDLMRINGFEFEYNELFDLEKFREHLRDQKALEAISGISFLNKNNKEKGKNMKQTNLLEQANEALNEYIHSVYKNFPETKEDYFKPKGKHRVNERVAIRDVNDNYPINLYRLDASYKVYNGPGSNSYHKYISKDLLWELYMFLDQKTDEVA